MKSTSITLLIVTALFAVGSTNELEQPNNDLSATQSLDEEQELTFYGEDSEVDYRFLKAKATKAPAIKSTKAPVIKSTKAPVIKSTKAPTIKSTKAPTMKSRRELV